MNAAKLRWLTLVPLSLFLSLPVNANHNVGYVALDEEQASAYSQCNPTSYNHWILVDKNGADLTDIVEDVVKSLPEPKLIKNVLPTITPSATQSTSISTSTVSSGSGSGGDYSSEFLTSDVGQEATSISSFALSSSILAPSPSPSVGFLVNQESRGKRQSNGEQTEQPRITWLRNHNHWPPSRRVKRSYTEFIEKPVAAHKVLILLDGEDKQPYTISRTINLNQVNLAFCTRSPSTVDDETPISVKQRAVIKLTDAGFASRDSAAIVANDGMVLDMNSVQVDTMGWSSNYPVILGLERAEVNITRSGFARLETSSGSWCDGYYDMRAIILLSWWNYGAGELTIRESSLYQGMEFGAIVYSEWGGNIRIINTEQVIAHGGIAINSSFADVDIIGGSLHGCNQPLALSNLDNLGRPPSTPQEFCPIDSTYSDSCGYCSWENTANIQDVHFSGIWSHYSGAIDIYDDTLKLGPLQNIGNTENIQGGNLCEGYLADGAVGAVDVSGRLCPPGHQLAESQGYISPKPQPTIVTEPGTELSISGTESSTTESSTTDREPSTPNIPESQLQSSGGSRVVAYSLPLLLAVGAYLANRIP